MKAHLARMRESLAMLAALALLTLQVVVYAVRGGSRPDTKLDLWRKGVSFERARLTGMLERRANELYQKGFDDCKAAFEARKAMRLIDMLDKERNL